jgi:hypothetical protein
MSLDPSAVLLNTVKNPDHSAFLASSRLLQFFGDKFLKRHHLFTELMVKSRRSRLNTLLLRLGNSALKKLSLGTSALSVFGRDLGGGDLVVTVAE